MCPIKLGLISKGTSEVNVQIDILSVAHSSGYVIAHVLQSEVLVCSGSVKTTWSYEIDVQDTTKKTTFNKYMSLSIFGICYS